MERMTVTHAFDEYEGETEIHRLKGDHITVSAERADHLRSEGLARSLPKPAKSEPETEPETEPEAKPVTTLATDPTTNSGTANPA